MARVFWLAVLLVAGYIGLSVLVGPDEVMLGIYCAFGLLGLVLTIGLALGKRSKPAP